MIHIGRLLRCVLRPAPLPALGSGYVAGAWVCVGAGVGTFGARGQGTRRRVEGPGSTGLHHQDTVLSGGSGPNPRARGLITREGQHQKQGLLAFHTSSRSLSSRCPCCGHSRRHSWVVISARLPTRSVTVPLSSLSGIPAIS